MNISEYQNTLLVTAGDFKHAGGWVTDTQFIQNMGVPYLLAHGLGTPVENAAAKVTFPTTGEYYLHVYTYNWVSPWKSEYAPGIFKIKINNSPVPQLFGNEGSAWSWQTVGKVIISDCDTTIELLDQTGFEGRVGLLLFTTDSTLIPPTNPAEIRSLCTNLKTGNSIFSGNVDTYDLVVCGGGIAGCCAAVSAARNGLKTALVQDRDLIGGNNSSEVRVWLGGNTNLDPFPGIGNIVTEFEQEKIAHYGSANQADLYEDERKLDILKQQENLSLYLGHSLVEVTVNSDNMIESVELFSIKSSHRTRIISKLFVDATGDGTLGDLCGADYEMTTNGHMGVTNFWYVEDTGHPQSFDSCSWAIDLTSVKFPGRKNIADVYNNRREKSLGCWFWESGCEVDPINEAEYTRDLNLRAMYGAWDCLKNFDKDYSNYRLGFASYIGGKRESRRLLGDIILTTADITNQTEYPDGCIAATWDMDVHYPDKRFYEAFHEGDAFLTKDYRTLFKKPYFIPYRCLYSRNIPNLFMAGRDISISHDALGTARVMRTGGMMGEVIGVAAKLCLTHGSTPRGIYRDHLDELMNTLKSIPRNMRMENKRNF